MAELAPMSFDVQGESTWQVLDVSRGMSGRMTEVRVRVPTAVLQEWSGEFTPVNRLYVQRDPDGSPEIVAKVRALTPNLSWSSGDESLVATLVGPEWDLRRHAIFGQRHQEAADADLTTPEYLAGLKCVFNPDGKPNRLATKGGASADQHLFHPDPTETGSNAPEAWSAKDAVEYVLQSYLEWCSDNTVNPVVASISSDITWPDSGDYEDEALYHVRVHGLTVDQALTEILSRQGMGWTLVAQDSADEKHTLHVFVKGVESAAAAGDKLTLYLPLHDGALPGGGAYEDKAVPAGHLILDYVPAVTKVLGYSGVKVYESTFELIAGWSEAAEIYAKGGAGVTDLEEQIAYLKKSMNPDTAADWDQTQWVGRRWILNETGREVNRTGSETPHDFSSLFGDTKYAKRRRPFLPHRMTLDSKGRYKDVKVLVSSPIHVYLSDAEYEWELLSDVAGVLFTGPTPPVFPWRAFVTGTFASILPDGVSAIAAVESDSCYLHEKEPASPALSIPVDQVLDLEGKLAWDNINGAALQTDFDAYVDAHAEIWKQRVDSGQVTIEKIAMDYRPGQWITSLNGRAVTLHAQIVGVRWDIERQQTHLALSTMLADLDGEPLRAEPQPEEELLGPPAPDTFTEEYGQLVRGEKPVPRRYLPQERGPRKPVEGLNIPTMPGDRAPLDRGERPRPQYEPGLNFKPPEPQPGATPGLVDKAWAAEQRRKRLERRRRRGR